MTKQKILIGLVIIFIITVFFTVIFINGSLTEELKHEEKIFVKTAQVTKEEISLPIHTSGKLYSKTELKLSFKIAGIIEKILVEEGQKINKGQLLAKLDQSEISAQVMRAKSGFQKASRDLERVKRLYADSVATLEQMQDATTGFDIAKSNLKVAEFNLKHSAIYAPTDGKILKRFAEENELVGAGTPIIIFGSTGKDWIVRAGVTDREILRLKLDDSAVVSFDAYPTKTFPANVSEIAEAADPRTGTFEIELNVNSQQQKLVSGFVAEVKISPTDKQDYFLVPIEALVEGEENKGFVFTLPPNKNEVKKMSVKIGFIINDKVAIESGLGNVENVITEGAAYLVEGSIVHVLKEK